MDKIKKLSPLAAIRLKYIDCAENKQVIKNCDFLDCFLHPYRTGKNPNRKGMGGQWFKKRSQDGESAAELGKNGQVGPGNKVLPPLESIRKECLACMCGQPNEVRLCPSVECPLYLLRFGRKPNKDEIDDFMKKAPDYYTDCEEAAEMNNCLKKTMAMAKNVQDTIAEVGEATNEIKRDELINSLKK